MNPPNIANLERILTGITTGELKHDQSSYFCGTACCLAGWDVALNATEQPENPKERAFWNEMGMTPAYKDPWIWSQAHNNLSMMEAFLFFDQESTPEIQWATLSALKMGRRLSSSLLIDVKAFFEGTELQIAVLGDGADD